MNKYTWRKPQIEQGINSTPLAIIVLSSMLICFLLVGWYAVRQSDKKVCLKWQNYEQTQANFRVSEKMNEFCSHYGVEFQP